MPARTRRQLLAAPPPLLAPTHLLGRLRPRGGIVRRNHRIVRRQAPLLAVLLRRYVVLGAQVTLERLELLSVLEADDVVGSDRLLDRDRGLQRLGLGLAGV